MLGTAVYIVLGALLIQNAFEFNRRDHSMSIERAETIVYNEFVRVYNDDPYNPKDTMELDASEQCNALQSKKSLIIRACRVIDSQ